jgi:hypothetical protein
VAEEGSSASRPFCAAAARIDMLEKSNVSLAGNAHRQGLVALHKTRNPLGLANHLNMVEALEDFFPDDLQLQLCQSDSDTTMNPEAEGKMGARPSFTQLIALVELRGLTWLERWRFPRCFAAICPKCLRQGRK